MRQLLFSYAGLLTLLTLTVAMSFVPLGKLNLVISLTIAVGKALLIMLFFMQLNRASTLTRMAAVAGFIWLAILFSLSFSDYVFRSTDANHAPQNKFPPARTIVRNNSQTSSFFFVSEPSGRTG